MNADCELCAGDGGELLFRNSSLRVVLIDDPDYPGFCRVLWNSHVKEMTDLSASGRTHLMDAVFLVESVLRAVMQPDKINLASLGNMTPHLHWHVIPRHTDDARFPSPIWAGAQPGADNAGRLQSIAQRQARVPALRAELIRQFSTFKD